MEQLAIPLGCQKTTTKWLVINETRREQKISTPHMIDMSGAIFGEQRRIATEFGFLEVPFMLFQQTHLMTPMACQPQTLVRNRYPSCATCPAKTSPQQIWLRHQF